jgi:hypothetical protein
MNRNKSPNNSQDTEHNSSTPNGRKRRLHVNFKQKCIICFFIYLYDKSKK